ncbi:hypothetical protein ACSYAD_13465 [Acaryochloris marina NIES-2412]|uniref:hypothetical protein n=1 Tax=Acaryochloris marina TaxID=155978 RepID=UPI004058D723
MEATIQGLIILLVPTFLLCFILLRIPRERLEKLLSTPFSLVIGVLILFFLLLAFHLFQSEPWTADILKVIVGVIVGVSFSAGESGISQSIKGDRNIQTINSRIERMQANIEEMRDTVVEQLHQYDNARDPIVEQQSFTVAIPIDSPELYEGSERLKKELSDAHAKPEKMRALFDRRLALIYNVPGVSDRMRETTEHVLAAGWSVNELRYDVLPDHIQLAFICSKRMPIESVTHAKNMLTSASAD